MKKQTNLGLLILLVITTSILVSSCRTCGANNWRKRRFVEVQVVKDTIPNFFYLNNQIVIVEKKHD